VAVIYQSAGAVYMRMIRALILTVLLLTGSTCCQAQEHHVEASADGLIVKEHFEGNDVQQTSKTAGKLKPHGATITPQGFKGSALHLSNGASAELEPPAKLNTRSGTISFWIKPLWGKDDKQSHTLLSMRWADGKNGYMAISQGWWEPDGANRLYFVLDNQQLIHCSVPYRLEPGVWSLVTVTWKNGEKGYCRLFVDDHKIAETAKNYSGDYSSASPIYLGSDKGTAVSKNRPADAVVDELVIYDYSVMDKDMVSHFTAMGGNLQEADTKRWKWLEDVPAPTKQKRDKEGILLESRVIFDEGSEWASSPEAADKILRRIKSAGFNVYVPCVWHGYGTRYPTSLAKQEEKLETILRKGYDPLAYLIKKAHSMGIEVHPWFTVAERRWTQYPEYYDAGTPANAYDMHKKEFRRFITGLMLDVVKRYDVDGVNLDYIRTMGICTSDSCKDDYRGKTGHLFTVDSKFMSINKASRERIQKWQDDEVADVVEAFSAQARKIKPKLIISVDGNPVPRHMTRELQGRDEVTWANRGWIDVIYNMDYSDKIDYETFDLVRKELNDPNKLIELFGNYETLDGELIGRSSEVVSKYAEFTHYKWPQPGFALYLYSKLNDRQINALKMGPFKEPAAPSWPKLD